MKYTNIISLKSLIIDIRTVIFSLILLSIEIKDYRTILHLERNGIHEYFGSPSSLFDKDTSDGLGITQVGLNNYFSKNSEAHITCYKN